MYGTESITSSPASLGRQRSGWAALAVGLGSLAIIAAAEFLLAYVDPRPAEIVYGLALLGCLGLAAYGASPESRRFFLALGLLPLMRVLGGAVPLEYLRPLGWYLAVPIPLTLAVVVAVRFAGVRPAQLGLGLGVGRLAFFLTALPVALTGLPLGIVEFYVLRSGPAGNLLQPTQSLAGLVALGLWLGLLEEIIFRGLLLKAGREIMGDPAALLYTSALYAVLQIAYGSWVQVALAFLIGLFFGWIVLRTRSAYAVGLAHGLANVTVFLLAMQFLVR